MTISDHALDIWTSLERTEDRNRALIERSYSLGYLGEHEAHDRATPLPDEVLALNSRQQEIWQALNKLSAKLRETAVLRYYEGLSYPEFGEILGIPTETAESRMRLAHKALFSFAHN